MRVVLIGCGIATVVAMAAGCGGSKPVESNVLNYDDMILLDAESLGEGSMGSLYQKDILPVLRQHVDSPAEIEEELDPEAGSYKVTSQGQTYVVYSRGMDLSEGQNWGNATFALFDIVNRQLQHTSVRFYAINGGNDLGGMFLTTETYTEAIVSLQNVTDWPYLPKPEHPWHGQPHEE